MNARSRSSCPGSVFVLRLSFDLSIECNKVRIPEPRRDAHSTAAYVCFVTFHKPLRLFASCYTATARYDFADQRTRAIDGLIDGCLRKENVALASGPRRAQTHVCLKFTSMSKNISKQQTRTIDNCRLAGVPLLRK